MGFRLGPRTTEENDRIAAGTCRFCDSAIPKLLKDKGMLLCAKHFEEWRTAVFEKEVKMQAYHKAYREKNGERLRSYQRKYQAKRREALRDSGFANRVREAGDAA